MRRPYGLPLVISLALHTLGIGYFHRPRSLPDEPPAPLAIDFIEFADRRTGAKAENHVPSKARSRKIPLSALVSRLNLKAPNGENLNENSNKAEVSEASSPLAGFGSAKESSFMMALWRRIDQSIEENPFLSEYNQTGKVTLRFEIDELGQLKMIHASAVSRVLKVIAARAVRKALLNPTGELHFPAQKIRVLATFHWSGVAACQNLRGYKSHSLSFCHLAENKRKTFSTGERVGTWVGAIYNYGPWGYEEIQKYNREESRRKSQFNPFRKYELDPDWNL